MNTEKTFKTKTGFCHILPDKIVLTRDGVIGDLAKVTVGNNISRILFVYGVISCFLFYLAYDLYTKGEIAQAIFLGLIAVYLTYGILNSLNNSTTPVIERSKIKSVTLKKAIPGFTRSRFEVMFENENGKIKKRIIMLPGSLTGGPNDIQMAVQIMTEENLLS